MSLKDPLTRFARMLGLTRSVAESMLFRFTGLALVYLLHILLARLMGPKGYGDYAIVNSWLNILLVIGLFGMDTAIQRFLPTATSTGNYREAAGFLRFAKMSTFLLSVLCSVALLAYLILRSRKGYVSFSESLFWAMFILPFLTIIHLGSAILRSLQRIKVSMLPVYVWMPILLSLLAGIYYLNNGKLTIDAVMFLQLCTTFFIAIAVRRQVRKWLDERVTEAEPVFQVSTWVSVAGAFFLSTFIDMLLKQTDVLVVAYLTDHTKAGIFAAATRLTTLVAFGLSVTDYVYMPKINALYQAKKMQALKQLVRDSSRQILGMTAPVLVILLLAGPWLLKAFGAPFEKAYGPLVILLFGQLINAATGMVGGLLNMTGHHRAYLLISLCAALLQMGLMYFLVPPLGLTGAALAVAVTRILLNLVAYRYVLVTTGIRASVF